MYKYKVYLYEDEKGKSEIKNFIEKLQNSNSKDEKNLVNKIIMYIRYLKEKRIIFRRTIYETYYRRYLGIKT